MQGEHSEQCFLCEDMLSRRCADQNQRTQKPEMQKLFVLNFNTLFLSTHLSSNVRTKKTPPDTPGKMQKGSMRPCER
jgi:hypothetical protein